MSSSPATRRRWHRFGLRTLFILLTVAAFTAWGYWHAWPQWKMYREQQQFVAQAKQIALGRLMSDAWHPFKESYRRITDAPGVDSKGRFSRFYTCQWPNALYVVFLQYKDSRCSSIEVFRLPAPPRDYKSQTMHSRFALDRLSADDAKMRLIAKQHGLPLPKTREPSDVAYRLDFREMISGDRHDDLGFQYEVVHSVSLK